MICYDVSGNMLWKIGSKGPKFDRGHIIIADDLIFSLSGVGGMLRLIEATPTAYNELASFKVLKDKKSIFAPMALSNGRLVVRDGQTMKCLHVQNK